MEKFRNKSVAGFSLIEMVVAMAVLIIGILGVVPMLAFNVKANTAGRNYGLAAFLAQERLEQIRSWPLYEDVGSTPGVTASNSALFGVETNIFVGEHSVAFNRTTEYVRNGYGSAGWSHDYDGIIFTSGSGTMNYNEASTGQTTGVLNTGNVGESSSGNYRGEDFKMIRVKIWWDDNFGHHEILRHMYLAQF